MFCKLEGCQHTPCNLDKQNTAPMMQNKHSHRLDASAFESSDMNKFGLQKFKLTKSEGLSVSTVDHVEIHVELGGDGTRNDLHCQTSVNITLTVLTAIIHLFCTKRRDEGQMNTRKT
jgi:hypothetical protein